MDLTPFVEQLRHELAVAAEPGGEDARALAERLAAPLESSVRLALLSALSVAAEELTGQLAPGSVEVRLRGGDVGFAVTPPPAAEPAAPPTPPAAPAADADDGSTIRITLRLPEALKSRVEEAAAATGSSVNTWLVRAVSAALDSGSRTPPTEPRRGSRWSSGQHYTGWAR
ncbi:UNVERIFIED_ORG: toxin-antitoxin system HicB family antitoxin [Bacillus sp. AZ43]